MSFSNNQGIGGIYNSLNLKESAEFKIDSETQMENHQIQQSQGAIPLIPLIQQKSENSNSSKEIQQELEVTQNKMKEIRNKMKEDMMTQSSILKKEYEKEIIDNQIEKMQNIYQQQIELLSTKCQVLEKELKYITESSTSKMQMLEDENQNLLRDLQEKSHELNLALKTIDEYKQLIEQYQDERQKNNDKIKGIDEGYKFLETELTEANQKAEYFQKQKNKYKRERNDVRQQILLLKEENAILEQINQKYKQEIQYLTQNLAEQEIKLENYGTTEQNYSELQSQYIKLKNQSDEDQSLILQYESNLKQIQQQYELLQSQYQNIIVEKNAGEDRYLKQIQDLEEALQDTRQNLQKVDNQSAKTKKKISELQNQNDSFKIQIEKYSKSEEMYITDIKSICRALEKSLSTPSSSANLKTSEIPTEANDSEVTPLISLMKNIAQNIKKEIKQKESNISKKKEAINQLTSERENLNQKLEQQKNIFKEKEQNMKKEIEQQSQQINEISKTVLNLQNENNNLKRSLSDLQISYQNFQEVVKDKESVVYQKITLRMMNYCSWLHSKIAHLNLIKGMLWSIACIYLDSSDLILKLNAKYCDRQELQDNIKQSSTKQQKIARRKRMQQKLKIAFKCALFISLLKVKKNTKLLLSQGLICNWITCANRNNQVQQNIDQYNQDELFKNPDKFIMSMNSNSDVLNFKDTKINITSNIRLQLLQLEQFYHKSTQADRDQIDFFNKKIKEISSQMKSVVDSRSDFEDRLKQQIFLNKQQQITIQQLQGEVLDLQFELKLKNRHHNTPQQNAHHSQNQSNYLK
ncbi:hypothetical protein TTHERM_00037230 (macronuclear) [Tetrahymena thermophila SB210]|uniref:Uncharacterized protein n=1 Tax=Tetrahymena thermophila (strain SB210) TaxID=312017 RepID=Q22M96_TETTS|nr:hypothetical protein TTHERM_00037230 [Tetrahymena thermophila SB210]EAR86255.1 hypothetical protein TTHERM_00037230 [Tetrahymena thermophila SB210]|eukprot:XP_977124.1 hypothetical protein TTHERM_00037230 [Tetrahymena thermophila SB210]